MHIVGHMFITLLFKAGKRALKLKTRWMKMNISFEGIREDVWRKRVKSWWWRRGRVQSISSEEGKHKLWNV